MSIKIARRFCPLGGVGAVICGSPTREGEKSPNRDVGEGGIIGNTGAGGGPGVFPSPAQLVDPLVHIVAKTPPPSS